MSAIAQGRAAAGGDSGEERRVAVVGGGIAGLFCAATLSEFGYAVSVFDMGKTTPGGRMTTRRTAWRGLQFDHGCQFLRPESPEFRAALDAWAEAGVALPWAGRIGELCATTGRFTPREEMGRESGGDGSSERSGDGGSERGGGGGGDDAEEQRRSSSGAAGSSGRPSPDGFFGILRPGPLYVGAPSSDAICRHLLSAGGISSVRTDVQVKRALLDPDGQWLLEGRIRQPLRTAEERRQEAPFTPWNLGVFDALVLADRMAACPGAPGHVEVSGSPAAARLLADVAAVPTSECVALLLAFDAPPGSPPPLPFDAASVRGGAGRVAWVCLDSAKPGRQGGAGGGREEGNGSSGDGGGGGMGAHCVVALATPEFSAALCPRGPGGALPPQTPELLAALAAPLLDAVAEALAPAGVRLPEPVFVQAHRWGSAFPSRPIGSTCLRADGARLVACGDFCLGGGVEGAVLSGRAAADAVRALFES